MQLQARRTVWEHRCASACGRDGRSGKSGPRPPDRHGIRLLALAFVVLLALNVMLLLGFVPSEHPRLTGAVGNAFGDVVGATLIAMTVAVGSHVSDRLRRRRGGWAVLFQDRDRPELARERGASSQE
ncbi:MAG: hypothetical protein ACRDYA_05180 [Egibacteraceae bacterium]